MKIVLDTNILARDFRFESQPFRLLFDSLSNIKGTIYLSNIVLAETINRFREDLHDSLKKLTPHLKDINRLTKANLQFGLSNEWVNKQVDSFTQRLYKHLEREDFMFIPYPKVSHEEIVNRDLARRRPFKRGGSGYRDFLIWLSILELARKDNEEIAFITNNSRDFYDDQDLHFDFVYDLKQVSAEPHGVELFNSLDDFNQKYVVPSLSALDQIKEALQKQEYQPFNIYDWIKFNLLEEVDDDWLKETTTELPKGCGRIGSRICEVLNVEIGKVKRMHSGSLFVAATTKINLAQSIWIDWEDYINFEEARDLVGEQAEPSLTSLDVDINLYATFSLVLIEGGLVDSCEVNSIYT